MATNGDASPSLREVRWHLEAQLVPVRSVEKKDQKNNKTNEDFSPKDRQRDFVKCPLRSPVHQGCLADLEVLVLLEVPLCREGGGKKKASCHFQGRLPSKVQIKLLSLMGRRRPILQKLCFPPGDSPLTMLPLGPEWPSDPVTPCGTPHETGYYGISVIARSLNWEGVERR